MLVKIDTHIKLIKENQRKTISCKVALILFFYFKKQISII
jgi:hypothetical protein